MAPRNCYDREVASYPLDIRVPRCAERAVIEAPYWTCLHTDELARPALFDDLVSVSARDCSHS